MASEELAPSAARNRLLARLPHAERERICAHMETVQLSTRDVLWEPNEPIKDVYFPTSGVVSLVAVMEDGLAAEVATIGSEGMLGLPVFLGAKETTLRAFSQVPGEALSMPVKAFHEAVRNGESLAPLLHRYTQAMFAQVAQSAACNRLHSILERCARWMLMTHDRVGTDQFPLTQEFLAQMVGVRRAGVNTAAATLQKAGFIRYARGKVTVTDRKGLESAACECYRVIKEEYDRLVT